ncbi:MAG: DEAD/DEAH box helicase family protein, partial [Gammaproteobacteria bacterium]
MSIHALLEHIKQNAKSPKEQGTAFENLCKRFLEKDKTYSPRFKQVQTYTNWAKAQQILRRDIGIDLVATNSNDSGFTAIQCKFYDANSPISKGGIDSFIAASAGQKFNARIFFDTTNKGPNNNVLAQLNQAQDLDFTRIGIEALEHSSIDWSQYLSQPTIQQKPKKQLRPHQSAALKAVTQGLAHEDRGKLIMACGTGKTFTALKIAEQLAGNNRSVLFLAPSLALVSQTITEWTIESEADLHAFAVCSDAQVGKRKVGQDDLVDIDTHDLAYPATTNARTLAQKCAHNSTDNMQVVFATYQSIDVISKAQQQHGLPEFDLIICDEAHKTTGVSIPGQEDSHFVKVHDQGFIKGHKRLYMTATPRVYVTQVKKQADKTGAILHSMDDAEKFGKELYTLGFGDAVQQDLLSDYKVLVLAVDEGEIARDIQSAIADSDRTLKLDDASKIVGCYKALLKIGVEQTEGKQPMRRAVAFCRSIKESELFRDAFDQVIKKGYLKTQDQYSQDQLLDCEIKHLDGTMNTAVRNAGISWLKHDHNDDTCRILTNVRCLSEGVDVPSLDAVLFVHSRKSKVDIVQSVGRVMRKAEGKQLGYVILPIVVSAGVLPEEALNNNKNYEIVWDVLNALRSHDERLDAEINRVEFGGLTNRIEVVSEISDMPQSGTGTGKTTEAPGVGGAGTAAEPEDRQQNQQYELTWHSSYDSVQRAILAKIVNKCGTRTYWADWAVNVAEIAQKHITRINGILAHTDSEAYRAFQAF